MKLFASILCLASTAFAQSARPAVTFFPFGPWPLCDSAANASYLTSIYGSANYCATLIKGSEPDLLSVKTSNLSTTDYFFIVTGVDSTGATKTITGHFKRNDNGEGYSSTIVAAGMTNATVTMVEYAYDPTAGSFLVLQNSTDQIKYQSVNPVHTR